MRNDDVVSSSISHMPHMGTRVARNLEPPMATDKQTNRKGLVKELEKEKPNQAHFTRGHSRDMILSLIHI